MTLRRFVSRRGLLAAVFLFFSEPARAVILYGVDTGADPNANTTAPTGSLAGSGWQYEGQFGRFLGTPIAPNYFITASHIAGEASVGTPFVYQGVTYTVDGVTRDAHSDLSIYHVTGTFANYAPLYTKSGDEVKGQDLVDIGRGTQRGAAVTVGTGAGSHTGGWLWGDSDGKQRWGTNTVTDIVTDPNYGSFIQANFDANGGANEATLSNGDSGGGLFIKDTDGVWKLAGINYGVDGPYSRSSTGSDPFFAAMFDTTGLYEYNGNDYSTMANNPGAMYATEIAGQMAFIDSVVPESAHAGSLCACGGIVLTLRGFLLRRRRRARGAA